jgi:cytochrome c551/c552
MPWTLDELTNGTSTATVAKTDSVATAASSKSGTAKKPAAKTTTPVKKTSLATVQPLLLKNTCLSCHTPNTKLIGPAYKDIAKKKYSVARIIELIQKPNPSNWPGYATKMPSMAHVSKSELTKIAQWIKSLENAK